MTKTENYTCVGEAKPFSGPKRWQQASFSIVTKKANDMINEEITIQDYQWWHYYLSGQKLIDVATLDGKPIEDGFALILFDQGKAAYRLLYKVGAQRFKTIVHLIAAGGYIITCHNHVDFAYTHAAVTVGNYPDTADYYERFTGDVLSLPITMSDNRITGAMWAGIAKIPGAEFIHIYPGGLWAAEKRPDTSGTRFVTAEYNGESLHSSNLEAVERELFDRFLIMGLSF